MTDTATQLHLGVLYTQSLDADAADHPELTGVGNFRISVSTGQTFFERSGDPYAVFKTTVATYLASSIFDTQVPADMWYFEPTPKVRTAFNLPKVMRMKR